MSADEVVQPGLGELEDVAIEEENGCESLVLGAGGEVGADGEHFEKCSRLGAAELTGVARAVEADVAADPADIGFLGSAAEGADPGRCAHGVEKTRGSRRWLRWCGVRGHARAQYSFRARCSAAESSEAGALVGWRPPALGWRAATPFSAS